MPELPREVRLAGENPPVDHDAGADPPPDGEEHEVDQGDVVFSEPELGKRGSLSVVFHRDRGHLRAPLPDDLADINVFPPEVGRQDDVRTCRVDGTGDADADHRNSPGSISEAPQLTSPGWASQA